MPSADPFDDSFCEWDQALTSDQIVAWYQPGHGYAPLGNVGATPMGAAVRHRACNGTTGCGPWTNGSEPFMFVLSENDWSAPATLTIPVATAPGAAFARVDASGNRTAGISAAVQYDTTDAGNGMAGEIQVTCDLPSSGSAEVPHSCWTSLSPEMLSVRGGNETADGTIGTQLHADDPDSSIRTRKTASWCSSPGTDVRSVEDLTWPCGLDRACARGSRLDDVSSGSGWAGAHAPPARFVRHTFGTHAARFGVNPWQLMEWMDRTETNGCETRRAG